MKFYPTDDLKEEEIFLRLDHVNDAQPEKRWLPAYYFDICRRDGTKAGHCDLRIGHNEKTYIGGNIGYAVDEPYRGHHYAARACRLLFRLANRHGMDYVIITCDPAKRLSTRREALRVIGLDTFVAICAGLIIFPACAAFNVEASSGAGLAFMSLPNVFNSMGPVAGRIVGVLMEEIAAHGCYLAAQCCEHLNRALVVEESTAERFGFEEVCVRPRPKAGGSFATAVYESMEHPVVVEHVKAKAGLDIGNTMIGMHMCDVAVPLRLEHNKIGEAAVNAAYSRPKLIGGVRADYPD